MCLPNDLFCARGLGLKKTEKFAKAKQQQRSQVRILRMRGFRGLWDGSIDSCALDLINNYLWLLCDMDLSESWKGNWRRSVSN